jgi:PPP family 3-phenylpropionic acid transporter
MGIVVFRRMVLIAALDFGNHARHDAFAVIRWNAAGPSPTTISVLWSEAVGAEVIVSSRLDLDWSTQSDRAMTAAIASMAAILRWILMASSTNPGALGVVQRME